MIYVDLKEFKKVLEEENKKGEKANVERIEEAKNKLLNSDDNLEETSQLLFGLENHTIEYSLQMLNEYLEKDKKEVVEENKKNEHKKLFIVISVIVVVLIGIFLITYFSLRS